jgi:hypothetical protein
MDFGDIKAAPAADAAARAHRHDQKPTSIVLAK